MWNSVLWRSVVGCWFMRWRGGMMVYETEVYEMIWDDGSQQKFMRWYEGAIWWRIVTVVVMVTFDGLERSDDVGVGQH